MVGVLVSVICWILWFSTTFDTDEAGLKESFDVGPQSFGRHFVDKSKLREKMIDLPKDFDSLYIPENDIPENSSHSKSDPEKATGLTFLNRVFYLNGQPFRIFSGAVHYFRIVPEYWEDRLRKLKACGLNTVET